MKNYRIAKTHNHTRRTEYWPEIVHSAQEFALEVFAYLNSFDSFISVERKLYDAGQIKYDEAAEAWVVGNAAPVIDLDDPHEKYAPFFNDYTFEMVEEEAPDAFDNWLRDTWSPAHPGQLLTEEESQERFSEQLRDLYPTFEIVGLKYEPDQILRIVDPVAYRCTWLDWLDAAEIEEIEIDHSLRFIWARDLEAAREEYAAQRGSR